MNTQVNIYKNNKIIQGEKKSAIVVKPQDTEQEIIAKLQEQSLQAFNKIMEKLQQRGINNKLYNICNDKDKEKLELAFKSEEEMTKQKKANKRKKRSNKKKGETQQKQEDLTLDISKFKAAISEGDLEEIKEQEHNISTEITKEKQKQLFDQIQEYISNELSISKHFKQRCKRNEFTEEEYKYYEQVQDEEWETVILDIIKQESTYISQIAKEKIKKKSHVIAIRLSYKHISRTHHLVIGFKGKQLTLVTIYPE